MKFLNYLQQNLLNRSHPEFIYLSIEREKKAIFHQSTADGTFLNHLQKKIIHESEEKKLMIEIKCESNYEMLVKESVALNKEP